MKTVQIRRYVLIDEHFEPFLEWWQRELPKLRTEAGFAIEFAYAITETREFVWAVSTEGDVDNFERIADAYMASDARAKTFADTPDWFVSTRAEYVRVLADAEAPAHEARPLA